MSAYPILQVSQDYRAGEHRFITVGTQGQLGDPLHEQIGNNETNVLSIVSGNIGIGTTIPLAQAHIFTQGASGGGGDGDVFRVGGSDPFVPYLGISHNGNIGVGTAHGLQRFHIHDGNAIVTGSGNVGIGTLLPNQKLHVEGDSTFTGHVFPTTCNAFDLGTDTQRWRDLYLMGSSIYLDNVKIEKSARDGEEGVRFVDTVGATVHAHSRNVYSDGSIFVDGNVGIGTMAMTVALEVHSTTAVLLPKGTTAERPGMPKGGIRYNVDTDQFEGYGAGDVWGSLGGVKSTDQTTFVSAEAFAGANDSNLRFYTSSIERARVDKYGNVGIGTDAPSSLLQVNFEPAYILAPASEPPPSAPAESVKYPAANLTSGDQTLSGQLYGNGNYISTFSTANTTNNQAWKMFNGSVAFDEWWMSGANYNNSGGLYNGALSTTIDSVARSGDWAELKLPEAIVLTSYVIFPRQDTYALERRSPRTWYLAGSLDGVTWTVVDTQSTIYWYSAQATGATFTVSTIPTSVAYSYYRIVVTEVGNLGTGDNAHATIAEMEFYGYVSTEAPAAPPGPSTPVLTAAHQILSLSTASVPVMTVTAQGAVGIGTTLPLEALHVQSNVLVTGQILGTPNADVALPSFAFAQDSNTGMYRPYEDSIGFVTAGIERMRVGADGNVGFGTSVPLNTLHVKGSALTTSHMLVGSPVAQASYVSTFNESVTLNVGVHPSSFVSAPNASYVWGSTNNDFLIGTNNVERLRVMNNGNIGIGTSRPYHALDLIGSAQASVQFLGTSSGAVTSPAFSFTENSNAGFYSPGPNQIGLVTTAVERLRVSSDGNVGIGTTSPLRPLHVEGDMYASGTMFASNLQILGDFVTLNTVTSNTEQMVIHNDGTGPALRVIQSGNNSVAEFYDQESGTALFIDNNGKIGMGTSSPPVTLSISGTDGVLLPKGTTIARPPGIRGLVRYNTSTDQFEGYGAGDTWGSLGGVKSTDQTTFVSAEAFAGANDSNLRFFTGDREYMVINSNGHVGIGTNAPLSHLHVYNELYEFPPPGAAASIISNVFTVGGEVYGNGEYIVTASSELAESYGAYRAFSKTNVWEYTIWHSAVPISYPQYLQIQCPKAIVLRSYSITIGNLGGGEGLDRAPKAWLLQGSVTGAGGVAGPYVTLATETSVTWTAEGQTLLYTLDGNYDRYATYRLFIMDGHSANQVHIGEWKLFGHERPNFVTMDQTYVGIGTTAPGAALDVFGLARFQDIETSNMTIAGSYFIQNDNQMFRNRLQINPIHALFQVPSGEYTTFTTTIDGIWAIYAWKTQVYLNGAKLAWISEANTDYSISYLHIGEATQVTLVLDTAAEYGDVLDITFWPSYLDEEGSLQPGYMLQNIQYTQWDRDVVTSNLTYVNGLVGFGTSVPAKLVDVAGETWMRSNVYIGATAGAIDELGCNVTRALLHVEGDAYVKHLILEPVLTAYNPTNFTELPPDNNMVYMTFRPGNSVNDYARIVQEGDGSGGGGADDYRLVLELHKDGTEKFIVRNVDSVANPDINSDTLTVCGAGVGIGTTSPTRLLDVAGAAAIASHLDVGGGITVQAGGLDVVGLTTLSSNVGIGGELDVTEGARVACNLDVGGSTFVVLVDPLAPITARLNGSMLVTSNVVFESALDVGAGLVVGGVSTFSVDLFVGSNVGIGTTSVDLPFEIHSAAAMLIPRGADEDRPAMAQQGYMRFNTTTQQFEGFGAGNTWGSLGGVKSTDQLTYILAESNAGANDSNLRFYTGGIEHMMVNPQGNVGIGTIAPLQKLHVEGDMLVSHTLIASNLNIIGQTFVNNDTSIFRNRLQINPLRLSLTVSTSTDTFALSFDGLYTFYPDNAEVYLNGTKLAWISATLNDFDVTFEHNNTLTTDVTLTLGETVEVGDVLEAILWPSYLSDIVTNQPGFVIQQISYIDVKTSAGALLIEAPVIQPLQTASYHFTTEVANVTQTVFTYVINGRFEFVAQKTDVYLNGIKLVFLDSFQDFTVSSVFLVSTTEVTLTLANMVTLGDMLDVTLWPVPVTTSFGCNFNGVIYQDFTYFQRTAPESCNITFAYGNLGIGTNAPMNPLHVEGNITFDGIMYSKTGQAIWIPGASVEWKDVSFPNPNLLAPTGGSFSITSRKGQFKYMGNDVVYNFVIEGDVLGQPNSLNADYTVSLEYPIDSASYTSGTIIGDCWLIVSTNGGLSVSTYKAYARTISGDNTKISIRYLNGTFDTSVAELSVGVAVKLQGTVVYKTTQLASEVSIPTTYIPKGFTENIDGYVALNNNGVPARARMDVVETGTSNAPVMILDQRGNSDYIFQARSNVNDIKMVIARNGNVGIGTVTPSKTLHVLGDINFTGEIYKNNTIFTGGGGGGEVALPYVFFKTSYGAVADFNKTSFFDGWDAGSTSQTPAGIFNASTGTFTAPYTGVYSFSHGFRTNGLELFIYVNSSTDVYTIFGDYGSYQLNLNLNDTVRLRFDGTKSVYSSVRASRTWWTGALVTRA